MYRSFLIKNLSKVIYFFISILVLFFFIEIFFFNNLYSINNFDCLNGWFSNVNLKLFSENSHFGMIAPAVICYMIFKKEKKNKIKNFELFIFSLILIYLFFLFLFFFSYSIFIFSYLKPQLIGLFETIQGIYINYT